MTNDQQLQQLQLLHRATLAFNASLDLDEIFHIVLEEVRHALQATGWAVWVLDEGGTTVTCRQAAGPGRERILGFTVPADLPLLSAVLQSDESLYVPDARADPRFDGRVSHQRGIQVRSMMGAPLYSLEPSGTLAAVGLIVVLSEVPDAFTADDRALIDALAASASVAIRNARLYQQAREEIGQRRRVESALRESEGHYRTLVETSPDAVLLVDLNGRIRMCNQRALQLYGYDHTSDLLGRSYLALFPPESRARAILGFQSVLQGTTLQAEETPLQRSDGTLFQGEIAAAIAANNAGEPASIVGFARDITDRKQAEAAMRRHNEELRVLIDLATRISKTQNLEQLLRTALDKTLETLEVDTGWIRLFDGPRPIASDGDRDISVCRGLLAEAGIEARSRPLRRQIERGVRQTRQPIVRQAVELFELYVGLTAACPVVAVPLIADNVVVGVIGVVGVNSRHPRSIHTRQEQLLSAIGYQASIAVENARLSAEAAEVEMLRELERMRSELIANFSHDLKTPLGLIEMSTSTLLRDDIQLSPALEEDLLRDILTQARRLAHLVEGILDLGRLESGRLKLNRGPLDVGELVVQVSQEMQKRYSKHHFEVDIPGNLLQAFADRDRVEQVLYNLLDNAAKYSPNGGDIRTVGRQHHDVILVRVTDSGIGIPSDQLPLIFERFYRVNDAAAEGVSGVGLGLPTCKGIVEAHGGDIWVKSVYGAGSSFAFTLPASPDLA